MKAPANIVITGASSGIGRALAECYAAPGVWLGLTGRNRERLEETAAACREKGAETDIAIADVTEREGMAQRLSGWDATHPVDLLIANAGISGGTGGDLEGEEQARQIFDTNLTGTLNTVHPLIPRMRERGRGQIAVMSSLAGFVGMAGAPAYGASKAAIRSYGEGLRGELAACGICVSVICPGFIKSHMTDANNFHMPMLMDACRAASIIRKGLDRKKARIAFPFPIYATIRLLGALPAAITSKITSHGPAKPKTG